VTDSSKARQVADWLFETLDGDVRLALPLGLGKPESLVNALYARAKRDPATSLHIYTALTLEVPRAASDLERRFLEPLQRDLFANVPTHAYADDLRAGALPDNVRISEFFLRPGAWLNQPAAQQNYISSNYTHAARDLAARDINVIAQLVARERDADGRTRYSLSCNPDVALDLRDRLDGRVLLIGEISEALPFMEGDAALPETDFDVLVEPEPPRDLFPVPNEMVAPAQHAIALRAAALVRDGGTLQIGIGGLGDAVAHAIAMRHVDPERFSALADALDIEGDRSPFVEGLYASSEMFVEGFLELRRAGVLTRTVRDGTYLHGGFFLGSRRFYAALNRMERADRDGIRMSRIGFTNQLLGDEEARRRDRVHARFMNTAMMVTLSGAVVSDGLEDGRVVSGVGGQFDFVSMAHQLEDARSIIMLPATRTRGGSVTSNIVWNYGHTTIPRHLRDLGVTEYGGADLRGASDAETMARLLAITDARFQDELRRTAIEAGKLPRDFRIAPAARHNTPEHLAERLAASGALSRLPWFPLGTDFSATEAELAIALDSMRNANRRGILRRMRDGWPLREDPRFAAALERMGLDHPRGLREHLYRVLLAGALDRDVHRSGRSVIGPGY
jgi:acyl-CoA hydrolase